MDVEVVVDLGDGKEETKGIYPVGCLLDGFIYWWFIDPPPAC